MSPIHAFADGRGSWFCGTTPARVDKRAGDGGDRNARDRGGVASGVERRRAVKLKRRRALGPGRRGDVRAPVVPGRAQTVQRGRVAVAQQRAAPGGEHRSQLIPHGPYARSPY
jgi:hypothetical protein